MLGGAARLFLYLPFDPLLLHQTGKGGLFQFRVFLCQLAQLQVGLGLDVPLFPLADVPGRTGAPPLLYKPGRAAQRGLPGQLRPVRGLYPDVFLFRLINFPVDSPPCLRLYCLPCRFNRAGRLGRPLLCLLLFGRIQLGTRAFGTVSRSLVPAGGKAGGIRPLMQPLGRLGNTAGFPKL